MLYTCIVFMYLLNESKITVPACFRMPLAVPGLGSCFRFLAVGISDAHH